MTERGFWDVAELSTAPLVATHSNAHELSAVARNLTIDQLRAIRSSQGLVGVNFATAYLRPDGQMRSDTDIELIVDHIAYLLDYVGEAGVALGSDFDGAVIPESVGSAAGLPNVIEAMLRRGFTESLISKIAFQNWMKVLERTI